MAISGRPRRGILENGTAVSDAYEPTGTFEMLYSYTKSSDALRRQAAARSEHRRLLRTNGAIPSSFKLPVHTYTLPLLCRSFGHIVP